MEAEFDGEYECAEACDEADVLKRPFIKPSTWTYPCCGGEFVHGTRKCKGYGNGNQINGEYIYTDKCYCIKKPTKNYEANYLLLIETISQGLHTSNNGKDWDDFADKFWKLDTMNSFRDKCSGVTLKKRLQPLLNEASKINNNSGFETHPTMTPYEESLVSALDEYIPWKEEIDRSNSEKKKKCEKEDEG